MTSTVATSRSRNLTCILLCLPTIAVTGVLWQFTAHTIPKLLLAINLGLTMPAIAQYPPANPIPAGFRVAPLSRATIFVRDQAESLKLYRDILGLRVRVDRKFADERFNRIMGTQNLRARVKILHSGDTVYGNIGIFELVGDDRATVPSPSRESAARTGDVAMVFLTNDIDGIAAKVTAAGYTIVAPPMVLFPDPKLAVQPREMLFRDRDGVLVNLIQPGS